MKLFGTNLREACKQKNVTAYDLQDFLHLGSVQAVYNWFNGRRLPTVDNLYALSVYLDVSIDELFGHRKDKGSVHETALPILSDYGKRVLLYWMRLQKKK